MSRFKVLIPDFVGSPPFDIEKRVFGSSAEIVVAQALKAVEVEEKLWHGCNAIIAYDKLSYDSRLLPKLRSCRIIVRAGVGYDNVDLVGAKKRGIIVCNVPDFCTEEVADHAIALLLSLIRWIPAYAQTVQERKWVRKNPLTFRMKDKVFGIIGLGRIGKATAIRANAFGLNTVFYDPYVGDGYSKKLGVRRLDSLEELAGISDIVSIHTPLTSETHGMINEAFFRNLKEGAILINTARGPIVNIDDLEIAMRNNIVGACGLDVLPVEPSNDSQKLIVGYENDEKWLKGRLIVTPHAAFFSRESHRELRVKSAEEAKRVLEGKRPKNCVNKFFD